MVVIFSITENAVTLVKVGTALGAGFTVTVIFWVMVSPLVSCTIIMTVVVPAANGVRDRIELDTLTVVTAVFADIAV